MKIKSALFFVLLFVQIGLYAQYYTVTVTTTPERCGNGGALLSVTGGTEPIRYNWNDGGDGNSRNDLKAGSYQVTIMDFTGRDTSVKITVEREHCAVAVPVVFTPNGDGVNDELWIAYTEMYPDFKFEVFNRWGQRVHVQEKQFIPWDGKQFGVKLPDETYYFVFYYDQENKAEVQTGSITILR